MPSNKLIRSNYKSCFHDFFHQYYVILFMTFFQLYKTEFSKNVILLFYDQTLVLIKCSYVRYFYTFECWPFKYIIGNRNDTFKRLISSYIITSWIVGNQKYAWHLYFFLNDCICCQVNYGIFKFFMLSDKRPWHFSNCNFRLSTHYWLITIYNSFHSRYLSKQLQDTVVIKWIIMHEKCGRPDSNGFQLKGRFGTHGNWKNQNPGGRFGATS